jgi:ribosomal protein L37AE/L43A
MYKKICNRCTRSSFSSSEYGEWLCPSCGNNLTESPFYKATILQNVSVTTTKKLEKYKNLK